MIKKLITIILLLVILLIGVVLYKFEQIEKSSFLIILSGSLLFIILNITEISKVKIVKHKKIIEQSEYLIKKKEFQNALRLYDESLKILPQNAEALVGKAQCYRMLTQYQKALDCCRIAKESDPNNHMSYYVAGLTYLQLNKADEALKSFLEAESKNPDFAEVYNYIGKIYEKMGKAQDSLRYYQKFQSKGGVRRQLYWKKKPGAN
jgi:tetratricopeptide (TPR) repeat protein